MADVAFSFWVVFAVVVGIGASHRGRSGFRWFLIAMVISPLLGIILLFLLPTRDEQREIAEEKGVSGEYKKCPMCAEVIRRAAVKCRYCGSDLPVTSSLDTASSPGQVGDSPHDSGIVASFLEAYSESTRAAEASRKDSASYTPADSAAVPRDPGRHIHFR